MMNWILKTYKPARRPLLPERAAGPHTTEEEIVMYESRCGVCCDSCGRKEEVRCRGCLNMEKTFWGGVCGVKACCESKGLNHCGLCPEFPCQMCATMGQEMGFDPAPRLEKLREWAKQ